MCSQIINFTDFTNYKYFRQEFAGFLNNYKAIRLASATANLPEIQEFPKACVHKL